MADATIIKVHDIHLPGIEVVTLTASDGETYTSRKFGSIKAAHVSANADDDAAINVTFSGKVATINWASVTDKACTLTLYGNAGN
jgi:hypothetical protein